MHKQILSFNLVLLVFLLLSNFGFSHGIESNNKGLKQWFFKNQKKPIEGSFHMMKNRQVYLENSHGKLVDYPFSVFSSSDRKEILAIQKKINNLNYFCRFQANIDEHNSFPHSIKIYIFSIATIIFGSVLFFSFKSTHRKVFSSVILSGFLLLIYSFTYTNQKHEHTQKSLTDPLFLDSAFLPFSSNVNTFHDNTYYYIESHGIPSTHEMMVGISNHGWQQQVPIPQCYIGSNAWSIPLNPVLATNPIPVNASHFLRGAIAIAVNGVPIFNVHTNTGVDSYLDGQLDNYGGHCGRGDDYHYHIAPLHLYNYTAQTKPIAFALDGFAVYGSLEPDGSAMATLDVNHGHIGVNGVYHYHGTSTAPYMIGNMVGEVTEDNTLQIIPQAQASPVRTENWGPLTGALITSCIPNGTNNGFNLNYSLNGVSGYATNYNWNSTGQYTFNYITPSGTTTINYSGFVPCELISTLGIIEAKQHEFDIQVFPNPTSSYLKIVFNDNKLQQKVESISIYSSKGVLELNLEKLKSEIDLSSFEKGMYWVKIKFPNSEVTKKIVID